MRANVYSMDPLTQDQMGAISDGLDLVSGYIGKKIVAKSKRVKLPRQPNGRVSPERVGCGQLDKMIPLHLFVVPLDRSSSMRLGGAYFGKGVSFVDATIPNDNKKTIVTAHEVGHAFGFVPYGSEQQDPQSPTHCCDAGCIMHGETFIDSGLPGLTFAEREEKRARLAQGEPLTRAMRGLPPNDFCQPCQTDMSRFGNLDILALLYERMMSGEIVSQTGGIVR